MLKSTTILFLCSLMFWSCNSGPSKEQQEPDPKAVKPRLTAGQIVDRAIEYHGGLLFEKAEMEFKFRDYEYRSLQEGGTFTLDRISYNDAIGKITDRVTNSGYTQVLNDEFEINIVDSMKVKFTNSVNSVHYFARLPYGLHAPAVEKKLIGTDSIKGRAYHEVEVRFKQEGGGVDFQDVFMYWFDTETGAMDYLAYSYETDGGGIRFRAAYNPREINGLRFQDYVNYKPQGLDVALEDLDYLYEQGSLIEVSKIELENVKVKIVDDAL